MKMESEIMDDIEEIAEGDYQAAIRYYTELKSERIWKEECGGRCAILHVERCLRYEEGECNFPETRKAKETLFELEGEKMENRMYKKEKCKK